MMLMMAFQKSSRECYQVDESSARVKELYTEGGPEADESTNIFFVSVFQSIFWVGRTRLIDF